jgi:hypothetical protein
MLKQQLWQIFLALCMTGVQQQPMQTLLASGLRVPSAAVHRRLWPQLRQHRTRSGAMAAAASPPQGLLQPQLQQQAFVLQLLYPLVQRLEGRSALLLTAVVLWLLTLQRRQHHLTGQHQQQLALAGVVMLVVSVGVWVALVVAGPRLRLAMLGVVKLQVAGVRVWVLMGPAGAAAAVGVLGLRQQQQTLQNCS